MLTLLDHPEDFSYHLEEMASKIMCSLAWDDHQQSRHLTDSAFALLKQMSPAGPITNVLTPLWGIPFWMNPWKQAERRRNAAQKIWWNAMLQRTRYRLSRGDEVGACWTTCYLRDPGRSLVADEDEIASAIGMLALVGIFTISGPLHYFLIAMVQHPEWQRQCQKELDSACMDRFPCVTDSPQLPTLRACIKETMRWRPAIPTGTDLQTKKQGLAD